MKAPIKHPHTNSWSFWLAYTRQQGEIGVEDGTRFANQQIRKYRDYTGLLSWAENNYQGPLKLKRKTEDVFKVNKRFFACYPDFKAAGRDQGPWNTGGMQGSCQSQWILPGSLQKAHSPTDTLVLAQWETHAGPLTSRKVR